MNERNLGSLADLAVVFDETYEEFIPPEWRPRCERQKTQKSQQTPNLVKQGQGGLTKAEEDYLITVLTNQGRKSGDYTTMLGISPNTAAKIRKTLQARGYTKEEKVNLGNGPASILIVAQKAAYDLFSLEYKL